MGLKPQSVGSSGGPMSSQSRISAWFVVLVALAGTVFLLEYAVFFTSGSEDDGAASTLGENWRLPQPAPRRQPEPLDRTVPAAAAAQPRHQVASVARPRAEEEEEADTGRRKKLAVVVPAHAGDLEKALNSLKDWPTKCHPNTLANADLVLYYAGGAEDNVEAVLPSLAATGGRCFANTRLVLANLSEEENVYPKGASVQFYKLYLDPAVRRELAGYDALAIIEWDVIVAHETSFEKLYAAAFGGVEPFWVKGSTLEGVNFHETVVLPESRHVLGHINGNAIYNNTDPAFVEFVNFTVARWEYSQSYDVALWATISDFPYSWPLWQRFARKFVAIDLIANVGFQDMDHHAVMKAVASDTLFIHGSLTGGGGSMFHARGAAPIVSPALRLLGESNRPAERCKASCGSKPRPGGGGEAPPGTSTVCDRSCYADGENGARFGGHLCGAGDLAEYGAHCRVCYDDLAEAYAAEAALVAEERLALERRGAGARSRGHGSGSGFGDRTADAKKTRRRVLKADGSGGAEWSNPQEEGGGEGEVGRAEVEMAVEEGGLGEVKEEEEEDEEAHRGLWGPADGGREAMRGQNEDRRFDDDAGDGDMMIERRRHVIMCDTLMPPPPANGCSAKCQRKDDTVCDRSCGTGRYGDYNCNWRGYGESCRFCFNDREKALIANDVAKRRGGEVIMCHTFEPPTEDEEWAPPVTFEDDPEVAAAVEGEEEEQPAPKAQPKPLAADDDAPYDPANEPYAEGVTRGQICAFMTGFHSFLRETEVTVKSVLHFMPGMRMGIATPAEDLSVFERTLGRMPGVRVSEAVSPITLSPILADRHCGEGTKLILYMNPGELLSRTFTSKDTHSARGELLVMYAEVARVGEASVRRTMATMSVLGFSSPSFSFGMDIMLPVGVNQQLRDLLLSDPEAAGPKGQASTADRDVLAVKALKKFPGVFVPEVLAALAYSRNEPGVWFINPTQWVTQHMFQPASIWDIPLVKPRFGCAFDISLAPQGYDVAAALEDQLSHFKSGSSCVRGFIHIPHSSLRPKASIEFGKPTKNKVPTISGSGLTVSVVFYAARGVSPSLLDASISSVAARFPDAAEVVVVFTEPPARRAALEDVLQAHDRKAPFPVEAIEEEAGVDAVAPARGGWPGWSGLRADDHAAGDFVMQLEIGDILVTDVTYENIFHFRKPVIPFQRLALEDRSSSSSIDTYEDRYIACGIAAVIDRSEVRDFALLRGLVYPRAAYTEMRMFASEVHNLDIDDLVAQAHKSCEGMVRPNGTPVGPTVGRGIFEASVLGSFMWNFMPDLVHWRALDPLDFHPDEWISDVGKYNLLCSMGHLDFPTDEVDAKGLAEALKKINSRADCNSFVYETR